MGDIYEVTMNDGSIEHGIAKSSEDAIRRMTDVCIRTGISRRPESATYLGHVMFGANLLLRDI